MSEPAVRVFVSPCSKQHSLPSIPHCDECAKLLVDEANCGVPKDLLQAAVQGGFIDCIEASKHQKFYFKAHMHQLTNLDAKQLQKMRFVAETKSDATKPVSKIPSSTKVVSVPKIASSSRVALPTNLPTNVSSTTKQPLISIEAIPSSVPSSIKSFTKYASGACDECQVPNAKRRQCTGNILCEECRRLPHHKLLPVSRVFSTYRSLCWNDLDQAVASGRVRRLKPVYSGSNRPIEEWFYQQDIDRLIGQ